MLGNPTLPPPRRPRTADLALSDALADVLASRQAEAAGSRVGMMEWSLRVPEPKAGKLDFDRFPPQREIYAEATDLEDMAMMKGTQVGISAYLLRWAMYWPDTRPVNALYVFPKARQMYDFASARINAAIRASDYLRGRVRETDNLGLKRVGRGFLYLRGSEAVEHLDSVDADVLALDEYDTLKHAHIPDAERRISGSTLGLIRRVGVPTIPDFGIAKLYDQSDKRQWHVKCPSCGERQPIDFYENVDRNRLIRVCRRCTKSIESAIAGGEWVAEYPDRARRGYHFSRLILPRCNLRAIVEASQKQSATEKQVFHNKDLGLPYAPEEGRLSETALEAATSAGGGYTQVPAYVGDNLVTMGVDMATTRPLTVRISEHVGGGKKRALFLGEIDGASTDELLLELAGLMTRFGVHMACIDHLPDGRLARTFADRHPGRVYLVSYSENLRAAEGFKINEEMRHVSVRRVDAIDGMMALVRGQRNLLPLDQPATYRDEMKALVRVVTQDETGKTKVQFISTGPDDFAQAETYDLVATMCFAVREHVEAATEDVYSTVDDHVEFDRSQLDTFGPEGGLAGDYHEGPGFDESQFDDGY